MTCKLRVSAFLLIGGLSFIAACGGDDGEGEVYTLEGASGSSSSKNKSKESAAPPTPAPQEAAPVVFTDDDFAELDIQNRDPFRSYAKAFKAQAAAPAQRRVLLPNTSLD